MESDVHRSGVADLSDRLARVGVLSVVVILAAALVTIVHWRYAIFRNDVDLGIFTQVISSTGHGFSSRPEGGVNHLLVHWSPIIATGWPFVRLFGPEGLQWLQAILVSLTLLPLWGMARARFSPPAALAVTAVCALYPQLCANGVGDFHEMAFVPLLSATLVYALDRRRWTLGTIAAFLLLCTKEDQFVVLAFIGAVCAIAWRGDAQARRFGLLVLGLAIATALVYFGIVRNVMQPHLAYGAIRFFDWSASPASPNTLPSIIWPRIDYLLIVLAPLAFLPIVSRYGLFLIPGFVEVLASHQPVTLMPGAHYSALLTGYALPAFVDGTWQIARRFPRAAAAPIVAAGVLSVCVAIFASPMEYWYYLYRLPNAHDARLGRVLAELPTNADVGSEDEIFSHMGLDPNASIDVAGQEWFVYDQAHYSDRWRFVDEPLVRRLVARRAYAVASADDGIVVLHRVNKPL